MGRSRSNSGPGEGSIAESDAPVKATATERTCAIKGMPFNRDQIMKALKMGGEDLKDDESLCMCNLCIS